MYSARTSTKSQKEPIIGLGVSGKSDILDDIEKYKNTYYSENKRAFFFKKSQKLDCAANISSKFDINNLLSQTVAIKPNLS